MYLGRWAGVPPCSCVRPEGEPSRRLLHSGVWRSPKAGRVLARFGKRCFSAALSGRARPAFHGMWQPGAAGTGAEQGLPAEASRRRHGRQVGVFLREASALVRLIRTSPTARTSLCCGRFSACLSRGKERPGKSPGRFPIRSFCSGRSCGPWRGPCARAGCRGRLPRCRRCRPCCRGPRRCRWRPWLRRGPPIR